MKNPKFYRKTNDKLNFTNFFGQIILSCIDGYVRLIFNLLDIFYFIPVFQNNNYRNE